MNEQLSKEERRNLRKAMSATATDAMERARTEVFQLRMEHAALAKTLQEEIVRLERRIDGASTWCDQNESKLKRVMRETEDFGTALARVGYDRWAQIGPLLHGNIWVRLKWALFGIVPDAWDGFTTTAQGTSVAPSQAVIE